MLFIYSRVFIKCYHVPDSILSVTDNSNNNKNTQTKYPDLKELTFLWGDEWQTQKLSKLCSVLVISAMKKIKAGEEISGQMEMGSLQF